MARRTNLAALAVAAVTFLWTGQTFGGECIDGQYCNEPCPAENSCIDKSDCAPGQTCEPDCLPSQCWCDQATGEWACTDDCAGLCVGEPIPTVSEWGVIVITLLFLTAGSLLFMRRRRLAA